MSNAIKEITRFQTDRGLDRQEFNWSNEATNIVEELIEAMGYDTPKTRRPELMTSIEQYVDTIIENDIVLPMSQNLTTEDKVDAFADIIVFSCGALTKLGYDPEKVLVEVGKEINSRVGKMVDGKFQKDTSDEAKAKWYKADFTNCKLSLLDIMEHQRTQYFNATGHYGSDEDIFKWIESLTKK